MDFHATFQKILNFFDDPTLDEVLINGFSYVVFSHRSGLKKHPALFANKVEWGEWLYTFAEHFQTRLDPLMPINGGTILDSQFRWHAAIAPVCMNGPVFCLRRHRFGSITLDSFLDPRGLLPHIVETLRLGTSMLIGGPTASGKTSFLQAIMTHHCHSERLVVLERLSELHIDHPYWIQLSERVSNVEGRGGFCFSELLVESLRLRPDRVVIGEIRSQEASVFLSAMTTGHSGCMATMHAGSLEDVKKRMRLLAGASYMHAKIAVCILERGVQPAIKDFDLVEI